MQCQLSGLLPTRYIKIEAMESAYLGFQAKENAVPNVFFNAHEISGVEAYKIVNTKYLS